jgi:hypothetical protein
MPLLLAAAMMADAIPTTTACAAASRSRATIIRNTALT